MIGTVATVAIQSPPDRGGPCGARIKERTDERRASGGRISQGSVGRRDAARRAGFRAPRRRHRGQQPSPEWFDKADASGRSWPSWRTIPPNTTRISGSTTSIGFTPMRSVSALAGCVAFYPTEIPLHHRSAWMGDSDPFGELAAACRKRGMVIVRTHRSALDPPRRRRSAPGMDRRRRRGPVPAATGATPERWV